MKKLIKRILREEIEKSDRHYRRLDIISDHVQLPYFKSMEGLTIDDKDDQLYIMKKILGDDIYIREGYREIWDEYGNEIYIEDYDGFWLRREYNDNGNKIYEEDSDGNKWEYNDKGKTIYYESYDGWVKYEYDDRGYLLYSENSNGYWVKREYDNDGNMVYDESSNGLIRDNR